VGTALTSDRQKISSSTLYPCHQQDLSALLYSGEMILNDVRQYLRPLPRGSAACVVAWPWSPGEPLTLIVGVPERGKVSWYRGSVSW
jgi:hypothetical protein